MITKTLLFLPVALLLILPAWAPVAAQPMAEPIRQRLLNGLSILFWPRPGDPHVTLKLRIHSGAAFDLAGKSGTMALLADALFPDAETHEYVREQLGGDLQVTTDYDAIQITISGNPAELERMIDLLRNAVVTPNLSAEAVAKLRDARVKKLRDSSNPADMADAAVAARLFQTFPYASPPAGTVQTVAKIDRADLMLAQERFLHADNASIAVIGNVDKSRVMRALRQLLGAWPKSDRTIPATFRQPANPDARVLVINQTAASTTELRIAMRGLARSDRDAVASGLLARIARERWKKAIPEVFIDPADPVVTHSAHFLPGMFLLRARVPAQSAAKAVSAARDVMRSLAVNGVTAEELDTARAATVPQSDGAKDLERIAEQWLDLDTYKLPPGALDSMNPGRVTTNDIQRVAGRLFTDTPKATVVMGNADQLRNVFGAEVEIRTDPAQQKTSANPLTAPAKP